MTKGQLTPWRVTSMIVMPVLLAAGTVLLLVPLTDAWAWLLESLRAPLGLTGAVARAPTTLPGGFIVAVPYLTMQAPLPTAPHFWAVGLLTASVMLVSLLLPNRFLPLSYLLRFAVLLQLTAILSFVLRPDSFPYDLPRYLVSLFQIGAAVLVLIPLVLGLTYFPFAVALWRKIAITVLCVGHLAVLIPLQVLVQEFTIQHLSLLVMPPLFFLWGILPLLFAFMSLYAWAMSWPDLLPRPVPPARAR